MCQVLEVVLEIGFEWLVQPYHRYRIGFWQCGAQCPQQALGMLALVH